MKSLIIGITGGIGAGKSTLADLLVGEGYLVYDTDVRAKYLQNFNPIVINQIKNLFGSEIYVDGILNRTEVGKRVFQNKELLAKLTSIVHPAVETDLTNWLTENSDHKFLFIESAILFESKFDKFVNKVILVTASEEVRIKRIEKRDKLSVEQIKARLSNQVSDDTKLDKCHLIIRTDDFVPLNDKLKAVIEFVNQCFIRDCNF
jgi:dephospho-CoA kinase